MKSKIPHSIFKASYSYQCFKGSIPNVTQSFSLKLHRYTQERISIVVAYYFSCNESKHL